MNELIIFSTYVQKSSFERKINKNKIKSDHFLLFFYSRLLFPKKNSVKIYCKNVLCHGPLPFLPKHLFCLSHRKNSLDCVVDNVGLKISLLGTSNSMVTLAFYFIFLGVNRSRPGMSSTNHKFYRHGDDFMVHDISNA